MKKKLLALVFTLVLLIGLVAAMGMNASAAGVPTALNRSPVVYTADNLWNYVAQSYDGDVIVLGQNITYDDKNDSEPYVLPFGSQSDMVLDLNGYTLDITTRADALIELDWGATRLHIINSKPETPAKIIMRTKRGNSAIVDLSTKNCSLYVYDGVELVMGKEGDQAEAYRQTHVIKATKFSEIALYGGAITNNIANGDGIKLTSTTSVDFDSSTVTLHGGAKIKAKTTCIALSDAYDYPTFKIGGAYLDCDEEYYKAISNYIGSATTQVKNLTFGDMLFSSSYGAYNATAGGRLDSNRIDNSQKLLDYTTKCDITFKLSGVLTECYHASTKSLLNYIGGHYIVCSDCYHLMEIEEHTRVAATVNCTSDGYTGGYNCACGYKTIKPATAYGHKYFEYTKKAATCTEHGYKNTMYKCVNCSKYYDSNKNETSFKVFSQNTIAPLGHDMVKVNAKAATAKADGNIEYYDCSRCDHITSDAEGKNAITDVKVAKLKSATLSPTKYLYDGKTKTPSLTVKDSKGNKLVKGTDYTISVASARKAVGKYTVTIKFIGKYSGEAKRYFYILPNKTTKTSVTQSTSAIKVKWAKVTGATGYAVEIYDANGKKLNTKYTTALEMTYKGLKTATVYKLKVIAYKTIDGEKMYSTVGTVVTTATKPAKPTLKATSTKGKLNLSWTNVSGETGYVIQYSTKKDSGFKKLTDTKANVVSYSKKVTSGKTYYFRVKSYKKVGDTYIYSAYSDVKGIKIK